MRLNKPRVPEIFQLLVSAGQSFNHNELGEARLLLSFTKEGTKVEAGASEPLAGGLEVLAKGLSKDNDCNITKQDIITYLFGITVSNMVETGKCSEEALSKLQEIFGDYINIGQ